MLDIVKYRFRQHILHCFRKWNIRMVYIYMGLGSSKKFYNVLHGFGHKNGVSSEIVDLEKLKEG